MMRDITNSTLIIIIAHGRTENNNKLEKRGEINIKQEASSTGQEQIWGRMLKVNMQQDRTKR